MNPIREPMAPPLNVENILEEDGLQYSLLTALGEQTASIKALGAEVEELETRLGAVLAPVPPRLPAAIKRGDPLSTMGIVRIHNQMIHDVRRRIAALKARLKNTILSHEPKKGEV